jgi:DNA repair protein RadA/Sms
LPKNGNGRWSEMESLPDLVARIAGSRRALQQTNDED